MCRPLFIIGIPKMYDPSGFSGDGRNPREVYQIHKDMYSQPLVELEALVCVSIYSRYVSVKAPKRACTKDKRNGLFLLNYVL